VRFHGNTANGSLALRTQWRPSTFDCVQCGRRRVCILRMDMDAGDHLKGTQLASGRGRASCPPFGRIIKGNYNNESL